MDLDFHARYTDGRRKFDYLDQYNGAMSLLGLSQILLLAFNAFFNKEILVQAPSAKGFRVVLGHSRKGSWDQYISLIITDPTVRDIAADIGKAGIYDLLKWAMGACLGTAGLHQVTNRKAKRIIRQLEQGNEDLHEKLDEALKRAHSPVKHQGLTIHVMAGRSTLITFNEASLRHLETEVIHEDTTYYDFGVSRFNARTGTGRFIVDKDAASVPFYPVDSLSKSASRALVDSLAWLTRDKFVPVRVLVSEVTSADNHLKAYRLHSAVAL